MSSKKANHTYNPSEIEPKWQKVWQNQGLYRTPKEAKNKKYILDMFPYPSGATLHVGHVEGYVGTDIISRYERMKGSSLLHPMGWDAFGLPAENYAIQTGIHPDESTHNNIKTFKRQLTSTGLSYDWDREIDTSDPDFYRWTQFLFILMFKRGLAYKKKANVNWCPSCETVLANEQVIDGKCERCGTQVVQKELEQWFLKITEYTDRLISGLDKIDWLEEVKVQQKNWIGRSEGAQIEFKIQNSKFKVEVFTTAIDTIFGVTFMAISPEHPLLSSLEIPNEHKQAVSNYMKQVKKQSKKDESVDKKKTGVFTGLYVVNPFNNEPAPLWIADYVLMDYGTGAVMGVPGHDARDYEFAEKHGLPIKPVVKPTTGATGANVGKDGFWDYPEIKFQFAEQSTLFNSKEYNGLTSKEAKKRMVEFIEMNGLGAGKITYHLRDWLISRQRYWGAPIPMIFCQNCADQDKGERDGMPGWYTVPKEDLPVLLPKDVDFRPTGESPIARSKSFQEKVLCPNCSGKAKREVDTMDTYVDSSWYFIRFVDPKNKKEFASREAIKQWLPVDIYVGGGHVVQHLLFARFFWKVLFDAGLIDESLGDEPFLKLRAPGWILGPDSRKMSKRWNNIVTPDDIIPKYGADTLRMYEMFMGPFEAMKPWSLTGVEGMWRFINRIWRLVTDHKDVVLVEEEDSREVLRAQHKTVQKVTKDIEELHFNTAIAALMEFVNLLQEIAKKTTDYSPRSTAKGRNAVVSSQLAVDRIRCAEWDEALRTLVLLLAPFAPHMTEELWSRLRTTDYRLQGSEAVDSSQSTESIHKQAWPTFDPGLAKEEQLVIPIQVNGRLRGSIEVSDSQAQNQEEIEKLARREVHVAKYLESGVKKVIFVPGKLINFVV